MDRAQVEQAAVVLDPPDDRWPAGAQCGGQAAGTETAALGNETPGAAPPPTTDSEATATASTPPSRRARASREARRRNPSSGALRETRTGVGGPVKVASSAARVSLSTRSARADGWRRSCSTRSAGRGSGRPAAHPGACRRSR